MTLAPGDLLTVPQLRRLLPLSKSAIYRLLEGGAIRGCRVSSTGARRGSWLVERRSVEEFVAERFAEAKAEVAEAKAKTTSDDILRRLQGGRGAG